MNMKKFCILFFALLLVLFCSGCCISHKWADATCTEPKTCSECGKTSGEALGHCFTEATCTEASTCEVCGATTGSPLGHEKGEVVVLEADYVKAIAKSEVYCARCNALVDTVEEPMDKLYDEETGLFLFSIEELYERIQNTELPVIHLADHYELKESGDTYSIYGFNWMNTHISSLVFFDKNGEFITEKDSREIAEIYYYHWVDRISVGGPGITVGRIASIEAELIFKAIDPQYDDAAFADALEDDTATYHGIVYVRGYFTEGSVNSFVQTFHAPAAQIA